MTHADHFDRLAETYSTQADHCRREAEGAAGAREIGQQQNSASSSGNIEKPRQRHWSSVIDLELALERIARVAFLAVARRLI